jgi:hypothetical protein
VIYQSTSIVAKGSPYYYSMLTHIIFFLYMH